MMLASDVIDTMRKRAPDVQSSEHFLRPQGTRRTAASIERREHSSAYADCLQLLDYDMSRIGHERRRAEGWGRHPVDYEFDIDVVIGELRQIELGEAIAALPGEVGGILGTDAE